jgi:protein-tyrosine phosphatase
MAEAMLRSRLTGLGWEGRVHSAGLLAGGQPVTPDGLAVMADRGLDTSTHLSRQLSRDMLAEADLVLGMAREHVREAVLLLPAAWPRTFTLKELVRRGAEAGPRRTAQSLPDWLDEVVRGRELTALLGESADDDVADPVTRGRAAHERTAAELEGLIARLVALVWSPHLASAGSPGPAPTT